MLPSHQEMKRSEQVSSFTLYWSGLESSGDIPGASQDADLGSVQGPIGRLKYVAPVGLYKRVLGRGRANAFLGCFVGLSANDYRLLESSSWIDACCDSS